MVECYPDVDDDTIEATVNNPQAFMQNGFLEAIQMTHPSLRADIIKVLIGVLTPGRDLSDTVKDLHEAAQGNPLICQHIVKAKKEEERLTPIEIKRLLVDLEPLDKEQIQLFLEDGLITALESREQKKQQRVHSNINLNQVEDRVQALVTADLKGAYNIFESISKSFERKNLGFRHNAYLCYIAATCWSKEPQYCAFQLGAGQGKTFIALLLA